MTDKIADLITEVRKKRPLVHHITNYVTVNDCANITICAGGSPVMTDAREDVEDMVRIADSLVLNIGTLNDRTVESMLIAGKTANDANVPVILDPVGVGATTYRTETVKRILSEIDISVIKGNSGEIGILAGTGGKVSGVDSVTDSDDPAYGVKKLARETGAVIGMTGVFDYISDGKDVFRCSNGHKYLGTVSGTGCMVSSVVGCYVGAHGANIRSVTAAITAVNVAGELAALGSNGPGSFKANLLDTIYHLDSDTIASRLECQRL